MDLGHYLTSSLLAFSIATLGASCGGGGGGGVPEESRRCVAGDMLGGPTDVRVVAETIGDNGTFVDECNGDGQLVEYTCEFEDQCAEDFCEPVDTGNVVPVITDGACSEGACETGCPYAGDGVVVVQNDAAGQAELDVGGKHYACLRHDIVEIPPPELDCKAITAGTSGTIVTDDGYSSCITGGVSLVLLFSTGGTHKEGCLFDDCKLMP